MMLTGRIFKEGTGWSAHCEAIGAFTQGPNRTEAEANLAEVVELKVAREGFKATVSKLEVESDDAYTVYIDSPDVNLLLAEVLKYQREVHKLSIGDVAEKLGVASRTQYARYEQGASDPSISRVRELLAAVAPEARITLVFDEPKKRKAVR